MTERTPIPPHVAAMAVAMTALLLFAPGLLDGFAYDDVPIVLGDPRIRSLSNLPAILTGGYWQNSDLALYRPVTTLSFALDWSLAPASAAWFHFTNVLLNAGVSVLVFFLLARLFTVGPALAGALLFAAHPVHVEAVTNIVGRAELLSAVFFLGCCVVWTGDDRASRGFVAPTFLFILAVLSKESAIMLPAALVLLDAATGRLRAGNLAGYVRSNALALGSIATVAVAYLGLRLAVLGALTPTRLDPLLEVAATSGARITTALQAWPIWLRLLVWPTQLLADYGPRIIEPAAGSSSAVIAGVVIAGACTIGGLGALLRGRGLVALALLWFPLTILPVSNIVVAIGVVVAERTLYLPSLSFAIAVAAIMSSDALRVGRFVRIGQTAVAAAVVAFGARSLLRIPDWRSTDSVMEALVRDRPDSFRGHWHLARMARSDEDVVRAIAQYDTAVALWPHRRGLVTEATGYAATQGDFQRASALAALAVRQWPGDLDVQRITAGVALDMGDLSTAGRAVKDGLQIDPEDDVLVRMAAALDSMRSKSMDRQ